MDMAARSGVELTPRPAGHAGVSRPDRLALAILLAAMGLLWLPAAWTPFWGDDYLYLSGARLANAAGAPWIATFWPEQPLYFWRPLSQEAWWRVVDGVLGGDVRLAHAALLLFHALAAASVGLLARVLAQACAWTGAGAIAALAAMLYGVLALHLLPVHWVAAANSPLVVLFSSLAMSAWLALGQAAGARHAWLAMATPLLLALALLSKESAILTPVLMLVLSIFAGRRPGPSQVLAWLACLAVAAVWLALRTRATGAPAPEYAYAFGTNLARNAVSACAWLLNVPREALRMLATGAPATGAAWTAAAAVPMLLGLGLAVRGGRLRLTPRQWLLLPVAVGIAYAPYLPLQWNSYAYYAAVAAIVPAIALARLLAGRRVAPVVAVLLALSSAVAVEGTRRLDHPGLLGRARWAESTLRELERLSPRPPLSVVVADEQRFYAIGGAGLAWRLGLAPAQVRLVGACPQAGTCLQIHADGRWQLAQ